MKSWLRNWIGKRKVLIAGFGREGHSSFRLLKELLPQSQLAIADRNADVLMELSEAGINCFSGDHKNWPLNEFDIIIKSPGLTQEIFENYQGLLTTQVDLFFMQFGSQSIGVTGTKGKSTTSSLLYHIFKTAGRDVLFAGNIGVPIFDIIEQVKEDTIVVCELSAHQLQNAEHVPNLSLLLNFFPEHLDHFHDYGLYKRMKARIATQQYDDGILVIPYGNAELEEELVSCSSKLVKIDPEGSSQSAIRIEDQYYMLQFMNETMPLITTNFTSKLLGRHNRLNALCACAAAALSGIDAKYIELGVRTFDPLPHRLEPVGNIGGVFYYNDSIATVPQASIAAIAALEHVDTLILGGFDRGLDYSVLYRELLKGGVANILLIGVAGKRMCSEIAQLGSKPGHVECLRDMAEAVSRAKALTPIGGTCLLSPAAASYDQYRGFEERGEDFKRLVRLEVG